jgi:hypothetical protein
MARGEPRQRRQVDQNPEDAVRLAPQAEGIAEPVGFSPA